MPPGKEVAAIPRTRKAVAKATADKTPDLLKIVETSLDDDKAEDIVAALRQPQAPSIVSAVVTEFGAVAALFDLAQRLRLVEHIDRHVPAGRGPSGPAVGPAVRTATAPAPTTARR